MSDNVIQEPRTQRTAAPDISFNELEYLSRNDPSRKRQPFAHLVAGTYLSKLTASVQPIEGVLIIPKGAYDFSLPKPASSEEWDTEPDLASELAAWDAASDEALASFESSLE
jgi:hypothetical protein